jgi:hypothetical protein
MPSARATRTAAGCRPLFLPSDNPVVVQSIQESIRINYYFLPVVDQAIASLIRRLEQYKGFESTFGFPYSLRKSCTL